ncbi:ectoine synthase, partial [Moorena sp. SIO2C4]|uniref:ectoine synthase n=1 Tax=Moorena sp. SIO2C4 TaxID=2607824 RepID=UPI0013C68918
MILRRLQEIIGTEHEVFAENKNWVSRQLLLKEDQMGFSLHDTIIFAKTETPIWSKNHVEALYCVEGEGEIEVIESGNIYKLTPGTLYALNLHEEHYLRASKDMRIICVFNPPLSSPEVHLPNGLVGAVR